MANENHMYSGIRSRIDFVTEYKKNRKTVGSLAPSSRYLARQMFSQNDFSEQGTKVLEVGPGTGVITECIFRSLSKKDDLTIVELNKKFAQATKDRLAKVTIPPTDTKPNINIITDDILNCQFDAGSFDLIICSLPFNNFEASLITEIFEHLFPMVKAGGRVRFFEYILLRRLKIWSSFGQLKNLAEIETVLSHYIAKYSADRTAVWKNFPPAMIYDLKIP